MEAILLIKSRLKISILILIFLISTISSAAVISASLNQNQSVNITNEDILTNDTNQTGNSTNQTIDNQTSNQTMDNQTRDALISNLSQSVGELNIICNESNETAIAEYSGQKLQELKSNVNSSNMSSTTKKKLLLNINTALQTNNAAINSINDVNEEQAKSELQYEYNLLNQINAQIAAANGTVISTNDADNLTNQVNQIKAGHENGNAWIVKNNPDMQITQTTQYYTKIQDKIDEIKNITAQLKAGGVPMEVKIVDASDLQLTENGTYTLKGNSSTNVNGTLKAHAFIPLIVIAVAGVMITINSYAMASIDTDAEVEYLEKTEGPVCQDCRNKMFELNFAGIFLGTVITWGIAIECMDSVILAEYGLGILDYQDFISEISGAVLAGAFKTANDAVGDGCDHEWCIFYKFKYYDLSGELNPPISAFLNEPNTINVTVFTNKWGNINKSFDVSLYVNSTDGTGGYPMQYQLVSTQRVNGLNGKSNITLPFSWTPTVRGTNSLKVVVDDGNEVNETDEGNNEAYGTVNVMAIDRMQLINTTSEPSSNDPNQPRSITYYFKADHPLLLDPGVFLRTPTFVYETTNPVYSPDGFQVFYPYGAIWQYYSDSPDGPWNACFSNPYVTCEPNVTSYFVTHWASGSGYHQYFAVKMMVHSSDYWGDSILKTRLENFYAIENK
jgi:hypothetical protein